MSTDAMAKQSRMSRARRGVAVRPGRALVWPWLGICAQIPLLLVLGNRTSWLLPAAVLVLCGIGAAILVWKDPVQLWSPMPWFLVASSLFFGLGPLLHFFGSPATVGFVSKLYPVEQDRLNRVFLLNASGLSIVIGVYWLLRPMMRPARFLAQPSGGSHNYVLLFWFTFSLGFLATLIAHSGLWEFGRVPGILGQLAALSKFSLLPAAYLAVRRRGFWIVICAVAVILVLNWQLSSLMKSEVLEAMTMAFLGIYLARPRVLSFALFGALALATYVYLLSPLTGFGRQAALEGERYSSTWELLQRYQEYPKGVRTARERGHPMVVEPVGLLQCSALRAGSVRLRHTR